MEQHQRCGIHDDPLFVVRQRQGCDNRYAIIRVGHFAEIHADILIFQMGDGERRLAHDVAELAAAVGEQAVAARKQEIQLAMSGDFSSQFDERCEQVVARRHAIRETTAQRLQDMAKSALGIRVADRRVAAIGGRREIRQIAVVREDPVATPQLALKGMRVLQGDAALCRLADMRNDILRADRIIVHQFGHSGLRRRFDIEKHPAARPFEKRDAPAILVHIGKPAARAKALERKADVRRRVAVHAKQLTHFRRPGVMPCQLRRRWRQRGSSARPSRYRQDQALCRDPPRYG